MAYRNNYEDLLRDIQASGQSWSTYDLDLARNNPDAGRSIYTQKLAYANAQTDAERMAANDAAEMIRRQYGGYTGGSDGSGFTLTGKNTVNQTAPSYTQYASKYQSQIDELMAQIGGYTNGQYESQYQGQIDDLMSQLLNREAYDSKYQGQIDGVMDKLMNRDPFSYNPTDDPSYAAYAEHYRNAGNQAREDTMAQAAAMTGGQVSSYAMAAAQQAQNAYNAQMSDIIPQLREAAYGMYRDEGNDMRDNLTSLLALDQAAYGKYMDEGITMRDNMSSLMALDQSAYGKYLDKGSALHDYLNALMAMDQAAYNQHQGDFANQMAEWEANYGVSRDALEDARYDQEWALALQKANKTDGGSSSEEESTGAEPMHFNDYANFYYDIKDDLTTGNYDLAASKFNANADRLTDGQYKNLMKLFDRIDQE